jgi:LysM repeat protein
MQKAQMQNAKKYTVVKGDTIKGIAEKNNLNWEELAKLNKIKAPYELKEGSTILIPKK